MPGTATSSRPGPSPQPGRPHLNKVFDGPSGRILCVADVRGQHSLLNQLAKETDAKAIIHTGDFGFFEDSSLDRINERTLRHLLQYSPLIPPEQREQIIPKDANVEQLRSIVRNSPTPILSEFPSILSGKLKLAVPVYAVGGACEDVAVMERLRSGHYEPENLHVIDEAVSRTLEIGGLKLRLLGLGGAFVPHKLFDNGDGQATIAGAQGTMWTTALQLGELVDTFQKSFDNTETRLLITHASPGREGLMSLLSSALKADLTISAGLHFRYASSWNEFSVQQDAESFRNKLQAGKDSFMKVWDTVKQQVEGQVDDHQKVLLEKAHGIFQSLDLKKDKKEEDPTWKNTWNWNLCDATFGHLVLDIKEGRVNATLTSQGFNYAYRRAPPSAAAASAAATPASALKGLPSSAPSPAPPATSPIPAINGSSNGTSAPAPDATDAAPAEPTASHSEANGSAIDKGPRKKLSNAEKRERKASIDAEGGSKPASPIPQGSQAHKKRGSKGTVSPAVTNSPSPVPDTGSLAQSPVLDARASLRSPLGRPQRNPWTLFVSRLPVPVSEGELRDVFGEHKDLISFVKLTFNGKQQRQVAFVEFRDEQSMQTALKNNSGKVKDQPIRIAIAENREDPNFSGEGGDDSSGRGRGSFRGRGGGRGRGLFAQGLRGLGQPAGQPRKASDASTNNP